MFQPSLSNLRRCRRSVLALALKDAERSVSDAQIDAALVGHGLVEAYEMLLTQFPHLSLWQRFLTYLPFRLQ